MVYRSTSQMKVVSLFSGCGGLDLGFKEAGFDMIYACDFDKPSVETYALNVDKNVFLRDVTSAVFHDDIDAIGKATVVLGGFPCQGFSKAGPKNAKDPRNNLYLEMLKAIKRLQPEIFIAENVDGLSQNFKGTYLKQIYTDFAEIGYAIEHRILDFVNFGVPEHRRRIIFVGTKTSNVRRFSWPKPTHAGTPRNGEFTLRGNSAYPTLSSENSLFNQSADFLELKPAVTMSEAIGDLRDINLDVPDHLITMAWPSKYAKIIERIGPGKKLCNVRHSPSSVYTWQIPEVFGAVNAREVLILNTIAHNRRFKKYGDIPNGNPLPKEEIQRISGLRVIGKELKGLVSKNYLQEKGNGYDLKGGLYASGLFKRPDWKAPSSTILTNFHNPRYYLHPIENRPLSLRECARIQGFPDNFIFNGERSVKALINGYKLVGNAVPPIMSRELAKCVSGMLLSPPTKPQQVKSQRPVTV